MSGIWKTVSKQQALLSDLPNQFWKYIIHYDSVAK